MRIELSRQAQQAHADSRGQNAANLFKEAIKEEQHDRVKGEAERDHDMKMALMSKAKQSGHAHAPNWIEKAIKEKDVEMKNGIEEEEQDNRIAQETSSVHDSAYVRDGNGEKESLIKLARQAMGEMDQDEQAKLERQQADDKAEVRQSVKQIIQDPMSVSESAKPRDSMLTEQAEKELSKDRSLALGDN